MGCSTPKGHWPLPKFRSPIHLMVWTPVNYNRSWPNASLTFETSLMHLLMIVLRLPIRCPISKGLRWTGSNHPWPPELMSPGSPTTPNCSPNSVVILALLIQKEKPKQSSRISVCVITKGSLSIWLNSTDWLLGSNGEMPHFNISSVTDFCPGLRMKSSGLGNPTIFRTYEPCHRLLIPNTGNTDPKPLEKLQHTKTWLTRKSQMTRVKPHLILVVTKIFWINLILEIFRVYRVQLCEKPNELEVWDIQNFSE